MMEWVVWMFLAVFGLSAALIVWMLAALVRAEVDDERRRMIVGRASTWTLIAVVGGDVLDLAASMVWAADSASEPPFVSLTVTALVFLMFLGWFKHKYGG